MVLFISFHFYLFFILSSLTPSIDMDIGHIIRHTAYTEATRLPTGLHPPYNYDRVAHEPLASSREGPWFDEPQCKEPSEYCAG